MKTIIDFVLNSATQPLPGIKGLGLKKILNPLSNWIYPSINNYWTSPIGPKEPMWLE